jgi:hypothetical protein
MGLLQLPESWHEACTTLVNLALAGLFKHPLKPFILNSSKAVQELTMPRATGMSGRIRSRTDQFAGALADFVFRFFC